MERGIIMGQNKAIREAGWNFDNSYARLPEVFYTAIHPTPVRLPKLRVLNEALAITLGLDPQKLQDPDGVAVLAGNQIPEGALPLAQAYAGHQFGRLNMLGDGRAILLGEQITPQGKRLDLQLKGSGRTPYSRRGDGRAALGPMLREYIVSEAMAALGIPTTRILAVVSTGEPVYRETELPGAVLTRVADSHLRVGTFTYVSGAGTQEDLRALTAYTLKRHFPEVYTVAGDQQALWLLREVIRRQAALIAQWQLVGFIHGVMNTDNMALSGETIDYGPCAFMDTYDPETVFSSIDTHGRYAFGQQPAMAGWNLARFAESLLPLLHDVPEEAVKIAQEAVSVFPGLFQTHWLSGMRAKLGLLNEEAVDADLIAELLEIMLEHKADYTNTFVALTQGTLTDPVGSDPLSVVAIQQWHEKWQARLTRQQASPDQVTQQMRLSNPAVIPRNHRVEEALEAAVIHEDYSVMERLLKVLSDPYAYTPDQVAYGPPEGNADRTYRTFCGT
jgi:uncharacterized protein YdiU (UPF0061 family)